MTNDEMKAAIEIVRDTNTNVGRMTDNLATVLALAEIGRLAVEARNINDSGHLQFVRDKAADAFIANQKGSKE